MRPSALWLREMKTFWLRSGWMWLCRQEKHLAWEGYNSGFGTEELSRYDSGWFREVDCRRQNGTFELLQMNTLIKVLYSIWVLCFPPSLKSKKTKLLPFTYVPEHVFVSPKSGLHCSSLYQIHRWLKRPSGLLTMLHWRLVPSVPEAVSLFPLGKLWKEGQRQASVCQTGR